MKKLISILIIIFSTSLSFAQYTTVGDANPTTTAPCGSGDCFELTTAENWKFGAVWDQTLLNLNNPFAICYDAYFGDNDHGADGIVFVLQKDPRGSSAIGGKGGYLAYGKEHSSIIPENGGSVITPSLAIEFDTYCNGALGDDITADHISIVENGDMANSSNVTPALPNGGNIEDGLCHRICIKWDPSTNNLIVTFDDNERVNTTIDLINDVFGGDTEVMWGLTAATGGFNNRQVVCINCVNNSDDYTTVGDASLTVSECGCNCFELNPHTFNAAGAVWNNTRIDLTNCFEICFSANFGPEDLTGADGIVFLLQNDPNGLSALGGNGGDLGYHNNNISPSLGVEFDTFDNGAAFGDNAADHSAVVIDGNLGSPVGTVNLPNLEDSLCHPICISWNPVNMNLKVVIDGNTIFDMNINLIDNVFGGVSQVYWGFTGSTGAKHNRQVVCVESVESFDCCDSCDQFWGNGIDSEYLLQFELEELGRINGKCCYEFSPIFNFPTAPLFQCAVYAYDIRVDGILIPDTESQGDFVYGEHTFESDEDLRDVLHNQSYMWCFDDSDFDNNDEIMIVMHYYNECGDILMCRVIYLKKCMDCCENFYFNIYGQMCNGTAKAWWDGDTALCNASYVITEGLEFQTKMDPFEESGCYTLQPGESRDVKAHLISALGDTLCTIPYTLHCPLYAFLCEGFYIEDQVSVTHPGNYDLYLYQNPFIPGNIYTVRLNGSIAFPGPISIPWHCSGLTGLFIGTVDPVVYPVSTVEFLDNEYNVLCSELIQLGVVKSLQEGTTKVQSDGIELNISPNPAAYQTVVSFALKGAERVSLKVRDIRGQEVLYFELPDLNKGNHEVVIPTDELSNGLYLIELTTSKEKVSEKLIISQ